MRLKIISCSFCFMSLGCTSISSNLNIYLVINNPNNKFSYLKESIPSWKDTNCYLDFYFTFNNSRFKLYSLSNNEEYKGYFIVNNLNKVETMYVGNCKPAENDVSVLSPIFSDGEIAIDENKETINAINSTSTFNEPPTLITNLYESYSGSFSNEQKITGCPAYFNPTSYMCTPTAFAMLTSFYDRYSYLSNLYWGLLPLNHDEDTTAVDNFIKMLADDYFMTTSEDGTLYANVIDGINKYFDDRGHGNYQCFKLNSFDLYSTFINTYRQPLVVSISIAGNKKYGHSILGIGRASNINGEKFIVSHYGERNKKLGDYYVSSDYFKRFYYIGEKA